MKFVQIILLSLLYSTCPELQYLDLTDVKSNVQVNFKYVEKNYNIIQDEIEKVYSNLNPKDAIICNDNRLDIDICGLDESIFKNPLNFDFEMLFLKTKFQNSNIDSVAGWKFYAIPKCEIRDKIPYPLYIEYYKNSQPTESKGYFLSIQARRYFKDDPDIPGILNAEDISDCPPIKKINFPPPFTIGLQWNEVKPDEKELNDIVNFIYHSGYELHFNCIEHLIDNSFCDNFDSILANPNNFDFINFSVLPPGTEFFSKEGSLLHLFSWVGLINEKLNGYLLIRPKCHIRGIVPFDLELSYVSLDFYPNAPNQANAISINYSVAK